jgi:hypothetical protein
LRDGAPVPSEEIGVAVPVDPGDHVVVVQLGSRLVRTLTAHVDPQTPVTTLSIEGIDPPPAPAPPPPDPPTPAPVVPPPPSPLPAASETGAVQRGLGIGAGVVGLVGLGLGSAFGLLAKTKLDESNAAGQCNANDQCPPSGLSLRRTAEHEGTASTVAFAAGGALFAGGLVLYLSAPRGSPTTGLAVVATPTASGGAAQLRGEF